MNAETRCHECLSLFVLLKAEKIPNQDNSGLALAMVRAIVFFMLVEEQL